MSGIDLTAMAEQATGESIPPALAAPTRRGRTRKPDASASPAPGADPLPSAEPTNAPAAEPATAGEPTPATPPAAAPADPQTEDTSIMATSFETATDTATDTTQAMFGDLHSRTQGAMERGAKLWEEWTAFGTGNVEALVESGKIAAKGFESMGQEAADYARKSFEGATQAMRTMTQVKSPTELFKLQGELARSTFDQLVAETSKSTEAMIKLAGDVAQPLSSRVAVAAEKIKVAA